MGKFRDWINKVFKSSEDKEEGRKKDILNNVHTQIEKLILIDCSNLTKNLKNQNEPSDNKVKIKIEWLINRIKEISNFLEEAHSYFKAGNIPYCINELVNANKVFNKYLDEINQRIDFLIHVKRLTKENRNYIGSLRSNIQRLINDLPNYDLEK